MFHQLWNTSKKGTCCCPEVPYFIYVKFHESSFFAPFWRLRWLLFSRSPQTLLVIVTGLTMVSTNSLSTHECIPSRPVVQEITSVTLIARTSHSSLVPVKAYVLRTVLHKLSIQILGSRKVLIMLFWNLHQVDLCAVYTENGKWYNTAHKKSTNRGQALSFWIKF